MKFSFTLLLLLAACAQPEAFTPVAVDIPVAVSCEAPMPEKPPDLMKPLPRDASLRTSLQACLRQTLMDKGYETELEAALNACR